MQGLVRPFGVRLRVSISLLVFFAITVVSSFGAAAHFRRLTPDGGTIRSIVIDPNDSHVVYALTDFSVFRSEDAGATWSQPDWNLGAVVGLAIDPRNSKVIYALDLTLGVYKTVDGGTTWKSLDLPFSIGDYHNLVLDPSDPDTLYASGSDFSAGAIRLWRTTNGGASWTDLLPAVKKVSSRLIPRYLAVDPGNSQTLYLAAETDTTGLTSSPPRTFYVLKSVNRGTSWSDVSGGTPPGDFQAIALRVNPLQSSSLYLIASQGLYRSTTGGGNWQQIRQGSFDDLATDPGNAQRLYLATDSEGLLTSTNGGTSWSSLSQGMATPIVTAITVDPRSTRTLYAGVADAGFFKSTDRGENWVQSTAGIAALAISAAAQVKGNSQVPTLYVVSDVGRFLKSTDDGFSWMTSNALLGKQVSQLVPDPANSDILYAPSFKGLFRSKDAGASWQRLTNFPSSFGPQLLLVDPGNPQVLYAGVKFANPPIYKSGDGGTTWNPSSTGLSETSLGAMALDPSDPQTLYALTSSRLFKSTDGGANWNEISSQLSGQFYQTLAVDPADPQVLFAITNKEVHRSADGGGTWKVVSGPFDGHSLSLGQVAFDHGTPMAAYLNTLSGLFRSLDDGLTWTSIQGLTPRGIATRSDTAPGFLFRTFTGLFRFPAPQWLFTGGDSSGSGNRFDGLALTNPGSDTARLDLTDRTLMPASAQGSVQKSSSLDTVSEEISTQLEPGTQSAKFRSQFFKGDPTPPGWVEVDSDEDVASFFQFGTGNLSQLDGGVAVSETSKDFFFRRIYDGADSYRGQGAVTRFSIFNPNAVDTTMMLKYVPLSGAGGGSPMQLTRTLPAHGILSATASELFGKSLSGGYVRVTVSEGGGVVAFETVELMDRASVLGFNASTADESTHFVSAQLAIGPTLYTSVNLINAGDQERRVTLTPLQNSGQQRDPVEVTLQPGQQFTQDAAQIFPLGDFIGTLKVSSDGSGIVGGVIFGDPVDFQYAAALPLQSHALRDAVFSQFASIPGFLTGLALYYPDSATQDGNVSVEVIDPKGRSLGLVTQVMKPGERLSKQIKELIPAAEGHLGGYIRITSDQPVFAQVLFVAVVKGKVTLFSAVPPTVLQ